MLKLEDDRHYPGFRIPSKELKPASIISVYVFSLLGFRIPSKELKPFLCHLSIIFVNLVLGYLVRN